MCSSIWSLTYILLRASLALTLKTGLQIFILELLLFLRTYFLASPSTRALKFISMENRLNRQWQMGPMNPPSFSHSYPSWWWRGGDKIRLWWWWKGGAKIHRLRKRAMEEPRCSCHGNRGVSEDSPIMAVEGRSRSTDWGRGRTVDWGREDTWRFILEEEPSRIRREDLITRDSSGWSHPAREERNCRRPHRKRGLLWRV